MHLFSLPFSLPFSCLIFLLLPFPPSPDSYDYSNKDEIPLSVNPNFPVSEVGVAGMGGTGGGEGDFLDEFLTSPLPQTQIGTGLVPVSQSQLLEAEPERYGNDCDIVIDLSLSLSLSLSLFLSALTLALQKQQQGIDTLKSHVPDQLSIDPLILTEVYNVLFFVYFQLVFFLLLVH